MKAFLLFLIVASLCGCYGGTYVVQQDGTRVPATFVEANAPLVQRSLSIPVCPKGKHEVGETTVFVNHEATMDTDRGRNNGYYDRYYGYRHESPVLIQQGVGGRKVVTCVPDVVLQEGKKE
jgi:hypothetical protein